MNMNDCFQLFIIDLQLIFFKLMFKELHDVNCSPNIIRVIKARKMREVIHISHTGDKPFMVDREPDS